MRRVHFRRNNGVHIIHFIRTESGAGIFLHVQRFHGRPTVCLRLGGRPAWREWRHWNWRMDSGSAPRRRFRLTVDGSADTVREIGSVLRQIRFELASGSTRITSGGCSSGFYYQLEEDPAMNPDRYARDLQRYLKMLEGREGNTGSLL